MPQPIRKVYPFYLSGLKNRPQHAEVLGKIIGISGGLESALGWLLAFFSRGSAAITIAMFHSVVSTDAQRAMLLAAADKALGPSELEAFKELMEDFRPRYGERSKLVHNIWGHSDAHPDKALWWRASDVAIGYAAFAAVSDPTNVRQTVALADEQICLRGMAYTVKDLEEVASRLEEYANRVNAFLRELIGAHPIIAAASSAATNAPPMGEKPQLDLHQPDQTGPQSETPA